MEELLQLRRLVWVGCSCNIYISRNFYHKSEVYKWIVTVPKVLGGLRETCALCKVLTVSSVCFYFTAYERACDVFLLTMDRFVAVILR